MSNKQRHLYISIAVVVATAIIITLAVILLNHNNNENGRVRSHDVVLDDNIVLLVNGEPITRREFQFRMERRRGPVIHHFRETYGADDTHPTFWITEFGGTTPMDFSRERTLEAVIHIKVEQILARDRGLIDDITYEYFLEALDKENSRRSNAFEQGQVVHGLLQLSEESFFNSRHNDMVSQLIGQLRIEGVIAPTQNQIEQFYYENIQDFRNQDDLSVQVIYVPYMFGDEVSENRAREILEDILLQIQVSSFDIVAERVRNGEFYGVLIQEIDINEETDPAEFASFWIAINEVQELPVGDVSEIIDNFENMTIIRCTARTYRGFMSLDDEGVISWISNRLLRVHYAGFIAEQIAAADIVINYDVFNNMMIPEELW